MTPTRRASTSLLALFLSLLPVAGAAQTSVRAPQPTATPPATSLAFHRPSIDGAPADATIHRIVQDHDGAMWFATNRGLFEYDGYTSRRFASDPRDPGALAGVDVTTSLVDRDGRIWAAGTLGTAGWLDRLDPRTGAVEHLPQSLFALSSRAGTEPVGLHLAENGDVWIGTNTGLHRWERVTNKVLLRVDGTVDRAPLDAVTRIVAGGPGELWLGTPTGLHRYEPASGAREAMDALAGEYVTVLRRDDDGAVWVGTRSGGLARLDPGTREAVRYRRDLADATSLPGDSVRDLLRDRDGRLLVATETGLARHVAPQLPAAPQADPARGTFVAFRHDPADARSLPHDDVRSLYQDASGLVWIGTARGLAQINPSAARFEQLRSTDANGLHSPLVWDLAGDADGTLWIATLAGLERYNPDTREVRLYVPSPNDAGLNQLQSVHVDRRNNIWVGAVSGHLYFFSATTGMFTAVPRTGVDGRRFSVNRIWYIGEGDDGRLWIAADEGLFALDVGTRAVVEDLVGDELPAGFAPARTMLTDSDGVVWFGGGRGLVRYETGRGVTATLARDPANRESLRNDAVRALHETADGALWVGTHDGLAKLSRNDRREARNAFRAYGTAQGLGGDAVYGIVPENDGRHLWLGTSAGLTRFDTVDGTFVNFTTE
ncbi:MAG TPA: two-component regulator propeller domain-containing protein, partial [Xanthomonadales bacterium]|nr:two-component regulator propeller domain-containing protein [Xanthomonadales bacterium]